MKTKLYTTISILIILLIGFEVKAQEKKPVSGIVTTFHQVPLNKVKVSALKSGEIAYTDSFGRFTIQSYKKDVLTATASGFDDRKIRVGKQNIYTIDLLYENNVTNFNDAVNNGHITETALQHAISADQLKKGKDYSTYGSIYELIGSEFYEVSVKGTTVYNKKIRSLNSNPQVLYVVDGKVVSDISFVIPADVNEIEFIDDVGATMWGVQGANGVLKITLK
ncbi:MAG: hypothetical protein NTX93_00795 [Bacteroidia bacterium]|nr:hypothetical protein [Bacteroidia bacterium]